MRTYFSDILQSEEASRRHDYSREDLPPEAVLSIFGGAE